MKRLPRQSHYWIDCKEIRHRISSLAIREPSTQSGLEAVGERGPGRKAWNQTATAAAVREVTARMTFTSSQTNNSDLMNNSKSTTPCAHVIKFILYWSEDFSRAGSLLLAAAAAFVGLGRPPALFGLAASLAATIEFRGGAFQKWWLGNTLRSLTEIHCLVFGNSSFQQGKSH